MASEKLLANFRSELRTPNKALSEVWAILLPLDLEPGTTIQLTIRISEEDVVLRDLSAFLDLVDRMYGRLSRKGFQSYSHKQYGHLEISRIRHGS